MPLSLFVLTSVRLRFKWFVQPKLYQEISFSHAFMSSSPVKRLVAGKRLVQHGFGFECLGCWPCRTAKVASSSLAMDFKSRIRTLEKWCEMPAVSTHLSLIRFCQFFLFRTSRIWMTWKKCRPQAKFCLSLVLGTFFRRDVTKIEQSKHFCNLCCEFMVCIHVKNLCRNVQTWCID